MDRLNLPPPRSLLQQLEEVDVKNDYISSLTPDLLLHVFGYLRDFGGSLCKYVRVCRKWQKLLEPLIYDSIQVYNEAPTPPRAFSLATFKRLVESAHNVRRRSMVRKLAFHHQATQFPTGPGETASRAQDPARNTIDAGFRKAVAGLFQILRFWESWYRIELDIVLAYSYTGAPQLASMANQSSAADLVTFPTVHCVAELAFDYHERGQVFQRIWEATPFHIAQSCANLASLALDSDAFKLTGRQAAVLRRRNVIAECLGGLPTTLEYFSMRAIGISNPYILDWFTPEEDTFSCRLLHITTRLRAVKLYNVTLPVDFWCPLNEHYRPKRDPPVWPYLSHIFSDDNCLVEGTEDSMVDGSAGYRKLYFAHINKLFVSLGYAARCMPRLLFVRYTISSVLLPLVQFENGDKDTGRVHLLFSCPVMPGFEFSPAMKPAWGFDRQHIKKNNTSHPRFLQLELDRWPPQT